MRIAAFILAVAGVLVLGRTVYELLWFSYLPWASLLIGLATVVAANWLYRRSREYGGEPDL